MPPPVGLDPFHTPPDQLEKLRGLKHKRGLACEFDCFFLPGGSYYERGRPCFARFSLLVERNRGLVLGIGVESGALAPGEAAGRNLVAALLRIKMLPETIYIRGEPFQRVLQLLCDELQIQLVPADCLPFLEGAVGFLSKSMFGPADR